MCDPATAAAVASTAQSAVGQKAPGGMAPAPMFGPNAGVGGGFGGAGFGGGGMSGIAEAQKVGGLLQQSNAEIAPSNEIKPVDTTKDAPTNGGAGWGGGGSGKLGEDEPEGFFAAFEDSMNKSLNSPARLLGVGLLNQMSYPLGTAGLLGKGLFDAFRR